MSLGSLYDDLPKTVLVRIYAETTQTEVKQEDDGFVLVGYYTEVEFSENNDVVFRKKLDKKPKTEDFFEVRCAVRRITR